MIQDKMVRARRQYHHRHPLNHHFYRPKRSNVPKAPSNTTQFIMNDHESIEPDFDLMHSAIMEHYNRNKKRKLQHVEEAAAAAAAAKTSESTAPESTPTTTSSTITTTTSQTASAVAALDAATAMAASAAEARQVENEAADEKVERSRVETATTTIKTTSNSNSSPVSALKQQQQQSSIVSSPLEELATDALATHPNSQLHQQLQHSLQQQQHPLQESIIKSNPTTPSHRLTGSPGDEDGLSPFVNHEHLQSEFQEVYANFHTERLSSLSKNQLVDQYLLLEERVEELENQLRESQTSSAAAAAASAGHGC